MSPPKYEMLIEDVPADNQNPLPYSENRLDNESDMPEPPAGPLLPMSYAIPPCKPPECQPPDDSPPEAGFHQQASLATPKTIVITPVEDIEEPDFMGFSYAAGLFCCLPLAHIAFFFSNKTRQANLIGDKKAAQRNSKITFIFFVMSLVAGIAFWIVYMIFRRH